MSKKTEFQNWSEINQVEGNRFRRFEKVLEEGWHAHTLDSCLRQRAFFPRTSPQNVGRFGRWTCQNREQRILRDFHAQPLPLAFSASTAAREARPTRRFHRFSIM